MELARRLFIYGKKNEEAPADYDESNVNQCIYDPKGKYGTPVLGGINNGYTEEELIKFWEKLKGYASYLFNKSHSASYAVITLCTMYLKYYNKGNYLAALLSMQDTSEKIDLYSKVAKEYKINISTPDINLSEYDFKYIDGKILYGMKSIKGVGEASIKEIIANRPYTDINDAINKVGKKQLNKRVLTGLIKSGAFDFYNENRYALLNEMYDLRKDKDDRLIESEYNENTCILLEKEVLGTPITYTPIWDRVEMNVPTEIEFNLISTRETRDKRGGLMAFCKLSIQGIVVDGVVFSSIYSKNMMAFDTEMTANVVLRGTKTSPKNFKVSSVVERKSHDVVSQELLGTDYM